MRKATEIKLRFALDLWSSDRRIDEGAALRKANLGHVSRKELFKGIDRNAPNFNLFCSNWESIQETRKEKEQPVQEIQEIDDEQPELVILTHDDKIARAIKLLTDNGYIISRPVA